MRKNIPAVFYILLPLLTLILSAPAAYAADNTSSGVIQVGNRAYQDGALSFDAELSGDSVRGQFAVAVFTESGQFRNGSFYPAASAVNVRLGDVGDTDVVRAMWLDDNFCPLTEAAVLRMKEYCAEAFAQFTRELNELYDELDASGGAEAADPSNPYALSRLIVSCDALPDLTRFEPTAVVPGPDGLYILQFRLPSKARSCAEYLQSLPTVRYAEPDRVIESDFTEETADLAELADASFHYSWGSATTGLDRYAENLAQRGIRRSVTVAVVDSGVDFEHPLLKERLLSGYDFIERDAIPQDELGHGTHVAGIVSDCVTGADVRILPVRVIDSSGALTTLGVYMGIRYAAEQGANIINLSLSSPALYGASIDDAVQYAVSKNITVIAAAGNQNDDTAKRSPAHLKACVTVAGVNANGARFPLSNFGDAIDLAAPAKEILSAVPTGSGAGYPDKNYDYMSGTSMAAPHVSAAAALLMTERGTEQSPAQISSVLCAAAKDLGSKGWDKYFGAGLLNLIPLIHPVISFQSNGGSGEMSAQIVGYRTETALQANAFTRAGRRFAGWNTVADGSGIAYADGASVTLDDSVTLYAQWEPLNAIYAILYGDGELLFQNSETAVPGRTVSKTYVISATDGGAEYAAWYNQRNAIRKVTFAEKIRPASTALWFYDCANLAEIANLENLDVSNVTDMSQMFSLCESLTELDLTSFDIAKATDMSQMFFGCAKLKTVYVHENFNVDNVTESADMFAGCVSLPYYDPSHTDKEYARIDGGADAPGYFIDMYAPPIPYALLYADGELVFQYGDLRSSERPPVTDSGRPVTGVYRVAERYLSWEERPWHEQRDAITTVTFAEGIQPESTAYWFYDCGKLTEIQNMENLDTSRVTSMYMMFDGCSALAELDVSGFYAFHVEDMRRMFAECKALRRLDVSAFYDAVSVTNMSGMFSGCGSLETLDLSGFNTSRVTDMSGMFSGCESLETLDLSGFDTSHVTNMGAMFMNCGSLTELNLSGFDTSHVTDMNYMFSGCGSLETLNLGGFDTSHVTRMFWMFYGCEALKTVYASGSFVTESVSTSGGMFYGCTSLVGGSGTKYNGDHADKEYARMDGGADSPGYFTDIYAPPIPDDDIYAVLYADGELVFQNNNRTDSGRNVTDVYAVADDNALWDEQRSKITTVRFADQIQPDSVKNWFSYCRNLTNIRNIENLNTSRLMDMSHMFQECNSLIALDASGFDTSHVTGMTQMFDGCGKLTGLDVSGWDTSNVTLMNVMFRGCGSLTNLDASGWNISNVTYMNAMFDGCGGLTNLDITDWNTASVRNMYHMFYGCGALQQIYASSLFTTDNVSNSDLMFYGCVSLVGGSGTKYDDAHTGKEYARIDDGTSVLGYFTLKDETANLSAEELFHLGEDYFDGKNGKARDYAKSIYYYEKSAEKGSSYAMNDLGYIYQKGYGVAVDYAKALDYYERAAALGNPHALNNLGYVYENGLGVNRDYQKAKSYYEQAQVAGSENAASNLLNLQIRMALENLI